LPRAPAGREFVGTLEPPVRGNARGNIAAQALSARELARSIRSPYSVVNIKRARRKINEFLVIPGEPAASEFFNTKQCRRLPVRAQSRLTIGQTTTKSAGPKGAPSGPVIT
jgi:hypothetical protein